MTTVVALGGNAVLRAGDNGSAVDQRARIRETVAALQPLLADDRVVVTHGNGPQVGNELLRQERAAPEVPPLPLYLVVAQTQAAIGAPIAAELCAVGRSAACLLTHVVVAEDDAAFLDPSKPIGPFYDQARADELQRECGWKLAEDSGRGWRRTVASPAPLEIVELDAVRSLLDSHTAAVACGGGGIPVVRRDGRLDGIEAVVDKDRASAALAVALDAERLVILTDVPGVQRRFGTPEAAVVPRLGVAEAEELLAGLPPGSMRPKLEACVTFARSRGGEALIASPETLGEALAGSSGTHVSP